MLLDVTTGREIYLRVPSWGNRAQCNTVQVSLLHDRVNVPAVLEPGCPPQALFIEQIPFFLSLCRYDFSGAAKTGWTQYNTLTSNIFSSQGEGLKGVYGQRQRELLRDRLFVQLQVVICLQSQVFGHDYAASEGAPPSLWEVTLLHFIQMEFSLPHTFPLSFFQSEGGVS